MRQLISNKYNLIILTYFFMGTVVQLRNQINNSYYQLKDSVDEKLVLVEEKIKSKLLSEVDLVQKMTEYHIDTGGKRLRALLTLGSAK